VKNAFFFLKKAFKHKMSEQRKLKKRARRNLEDYKLIRRRMKKAKRSEAEHMETAEQLAHAVRKSLKDGDMESLGGAVEKLEGFIEEKLGPYKPNAFWETVKALLIAVMIALFIRWMFIEPFRIPSGSMIPTLLIGDQLMVNRMAYGPDVLVPYIDPDESPEAIVELKKKGAASYSFEVGDHKVVLVWQKLWMRRAPRRGEIVVFRYPHNPREDYIKRVIGIAGDKVEIREGKLYINDQLQKEIYAGPYDGPTGNGGCYTGYDLFDEQLDSGGEIKIHDVLHCRPRSRSMNNWAYGPETVPEGMFLGMGDNRDCSADSRSWGFVPESHLKGTAMFIHLPLDPERHYMPRWKRFFKSIK
jgi:signal peptidase I